MAKESVELLGKILYVRLKGALTHADIMNIRDKALSITKEKGKPVDILIDLKQAEVVTPEAKEESKKLLEDVPFRRMAIFTNRPSVVSMANWIVKTVSDNNKVKLFRDEQLAYEWLTKASGPFRSFANK